jgi:hypothetical protein
MTTERAICLGFMVGLLYNVYAVVSCSAVPLLTVSTANTGYVGWSGAQSNTISLLDKMKQIWGPLIVYHAQKQM